MSLGKRRGLIVWQTAPIPAIPYLYAVNASSLICPILSKHVKELPEDSQTQLISWGELTGPSQRLAQKDAAHANQLWVGQMTIPGFQMTSCIPHDGTDTVLVPACTHHCVKKKGLKVRTVQHIDIKHLMPRSPRASANS